MQVHVLKVWQPVEMKINMISKVGMEEEFEGRQRGGDMNMLFRDRVPCTWWLQGKLGRSKVVNLPKLMLFDWIWSFLLS